MEAPTEPESEMKAKIINWSLISAMAFLTACGGSDSPTTESTTTPKDTVNDDGTPVIDFGDPKANIGLGYGFGAQFQKGVAQPALSVLSSGGSTSVTVNIVNLDKSNELYLGQRTVTFNSYCSQLGLAEFTPASIEASGLAVSNYEDKGCGQVDNIFVSIVEEEKSEEGEITQNIVATANTTIDVKLPIIGAINFVAAEPASIALKGVGSGTLPEMSTLSFQVLDRSGNPMFSKEVRFAMDHLLGDASLSRDNAVTNLEGIASIQLFSGRVNGTVRVSATVDVHDDEGNYVTEISTQSNPVGMVTGLPDINSFSLGATIYNPAAWDINGTKVSITARASDHYQNPVPDGTVVAFSAEGGSVVGTCETSVGACSVEWTAQDPRPVDGVATIVARTVGVSDYQDKNSNGVFDIGELFITQGEAYIDANGNGVYDNEALYNQFVDFDSDGTPDVLWDDTTTNFYEEFFDFNDNSVLDGLPTKYQGVSCSDAAITAGHCATLGVVSDSIQLIMSEIYAPLIEGPYLLDKTTNRFETEVSCIDVSGGDRQLMWRVSDSKERRNKLAYGSSISFSSDSWFKFFSGGEAETIANESAPMRFDQWVQIPSNAIKSNDQKKYDYINERAHTFFATIGRDLTATKWEEMGVVSINAGYGTTDTSSSISVSAIGDIYYELREAGGPVVSSIDVSAGPKAYEMVVKTPCGDGLEPGALITLEIGNGIASAWYSTDALNQQASNIGTIVVTEDRRAGGNVLGFTLGTDGASSLSANSLTLSSRNGQVAEDVKNIIDIQD